MCVELVSLTQCEMLPGNLRGGELTQLWFLFRSNPAFRKYFTLDQRNKFNAHWTTANEHFTSALSAKYIDALTQDGSLSTTMLRVL
jgi:hypothetical protein